MNKPKVDSIETAAMDAPTEPALGLEASPAAPLTIKRATLVAATTDIEDSAPSSAPLRNIESYVGFIVDGRYQIESVIAQGGMGVVYLARHRLIEKLVALKILRPELVHNREITRRFLTEAQAASSIGSEHIVDVTDFGELPDGATYIVMEYLDGYSLNQRMRREADLLPLPLVLHIARQIAEALQQAHDANIVHRDLKPDNVLLITRGKQADFVKILDFGIAKVASSQNQTTTAGKIFGTPHYMSPEQGRGDELDHRTDIYSLGVMLYEMLCGRVPFDGENPLGILTQHMYVDVKPLTQVCPKDRVSFGLECVVARCLLKDPAFRYGSMTELDEDLARLEHLTPPLALQYFRATGHAPNYLKPLLKDAEPSRTGVFIALGLGTLAAVALGSLLVENRRQDKVPQAEAVVSQHVELSTQPPPAHPASTTERPRPATHHAAGGAVHAAAADAGAPSNADAAAPSDTVGHNADAGSPPHQASVDDKTNPLSPAPDSPAPGKPAPDNPTPDATDDPGPAPTTPNRPTVKRPAVRPPSAIPPVVVPPQYPSRPPAERPPPGPPPKTDTPEPTPSSAPLPDPGLRPDPTPQKPAPTATPPGPPPAPDGESDVAPSPGSLGL